MFSVHNLTYILTILEAIEKIKIYSSKFDDAYVFFKANEQMNFNACQTLLLAIGEESKKIDDSLKHEHGEIPWHLIADLRNRIAHDYRGVDPFITFDIIMNYLPPLKEEILLMLNKINLDSVDINEILATDYYSHLNYLVNTIISEDLINASADAKGFAFEVVERDEEE